MGSLASDFLIDLSHDVGETGQSLRRIVRQLLIESLCLSTLGALTGLAFAFWADKALMALYLPIGAGGLNISTAPDARILLFALVVTVVTGLVFGLVPALQTTKPDVGRTLKDHLLLRHPTGEKHYNVLQKIVYTGVVFGLGPLIVLTGLAIGGGHLLASTRQWINEMEVPPSELARLKFLESRTGAILDFWGDNVVHVAVFSCMAIGWSVHAAAAGLRLACRR